MIFMSGAQEGVGGGGWERGEGEGERRECYWPSSPTSMLYMQTENGYFVSGLAEMQSYLNDL